MKKFLFLLISLSFAFVTSSIYAEDITEVVVHNKSPGIIWYMPKNQVGNPVYPDGKRMMYFSTRNSLYEIKGWVGTDLFVNCEVSLNSQQQIQVKDLLNKQMSETYTCFLTNPPNSPYFWVTVAQR